MADSPELAPKHCSGDEGDRGYRSGPAVGSATWPPLRILELSRAVWIRHRHLTTASCEMLARHSNQALVVDVQTIIVT